MFECFKRIGRYKKNNVFVSTVIALDTGRFETAVSHPRYNNEKLVIVEEYDDEELAEFGHKKWVQKMINKKLPVSLKDVATNSIATLCSVVNGDGWRDNKII